LEPTNAMAKLLAVAKVVALLLLLLLRYEAALP
jgi:hypothetical protein